MIATSLLIAQTAQVAFVTVWMATAVRDNIAAPRLNANSVGEIMQLEAMRLQFPEHFAAVKARRIQNPAHHALLFRMIVGAEVAVTILLAAALGLMLAAVAGVVAAPFAKAAAIIALTGFTSIWAGFLAGGNYFVYWLCHGNAQHTHFGLLLWGLAALLFVTIA